MTDSDQHASTSYAFIGAVHGLLTADRVTNRLDLVLAAALHALFEGDKTAAEVRDRVDQIWPGALSTQEEVASALELGHSLNLLADRRSLTDEVVWTLTKDGVDDVIRHQEWVNGVRELALADVTKKATESMLMTPQREVAEL